MKQTNKDKIIKKKPSQQKVKAVSKPFIYKPLVVFSILFIVSLIIYSGGFSNKIVFLDDDMMFDNLKLLYQKPFSIIHESYTRDAMIGIGGDLYRPVQTFALIFLYGLGDGNMLYFHLMQLLLHVVGCYLIYFLLVTLNFDKNKALVLTLIYTVHPLFAPLVCFVPAIGDQLLLVLGIASFLSFIYFTRTKKTVFLVLHILLFLLALLTKETALVFPAVFIFFALFIENSKPYKVLLLPLIFWIALPLLFIIVRQHFILPELVAPHNVLNFKNISTNFSYNTPSFFEFIAKFFIPYKLSFLAPFSSVRTLMGLVFIVVFIVLAVLKKLDYKWFFFSLLWYSVFILPPMLYRNPVFDYGEHRGFLPLVSFLFLVAAVKQTNKYFGFLYIIVPVLAFISFNRKADFKDPMAFYTGIIDNDPVPIAYLNRGAYNQKQKKDLKSVLDDYNNAIALKKDYATALYNRAILKSEDLKDIEGAFSDLKAAIESKPNYADAYYHRGYLELTALKDTKKALADMDSAIVLNPNYVLAYNNRGILKMSYLNDTIGAFNDFDKSVSLQSQYNPTAFFYRGLISYNNKDLAKACGDWNIAQQQGHKQAYDLYTSYCSK